jgi:hypothetical protein
VNVRIGANSTRVRRIIRINRASGRVEASDRLARDDFVPLGQRRQRSERGARRVILIVAITLRRQHGAIGINETHTAEGRVVDLARKVHVRLIRIEVHCGSAHFQRVLAGDDGTGKHGESTGPFARSVFLAGFDDGAVFIGEVAGCQSRDVRSIGGRRQERGKSSGTQGSRYDERTRH